MLENKTLISDNIANSINNTTFVTDDGIETKIDDLLTPQQKYQLLLQVINNLPKDDFECVLDFHNKFNVQKEETHIITDFKYNKLRFNLILEECMELGFSLGLDRSIIYESFIDTLSKVYNKIYDKNIQVSLTEVADALTDILFVTYGAFDVFNLKEPQYKLMQEVYKSNMSKLISKEINGWLTLVTDTVKNYKEKGIEVISKEVDNSYIAIINKRTGKILKPVSFKEPNLETIINNHLNQ